jgi:predicted secreted protein
MMGPRLRKLALTAHVISSVGWLGAVAAFLALAVAGLVSGDPQRVRAVYLAMELTAWFALIPLSVASLLTGLAQSLGTVWGLFRHYWVVAKLVLNVLATTVLLFYMGTLSELADLARTNSDVDGLASASPILHSGAALLLLVTATILAVYKPRGLTGYGRRKLG